MLLARRRLRRRAGSDACEPPYAGRVRRNAGVCRVGRCVTSKPVAMTVILTSFSRLRVDHRAENDVGFGIGRLRHDVGGFVDLAQRQVDAAGDVEQDAAWRPPC